jgi:hypothetical protein
MRQQAARTSTSTIEGIDRAPNPAGKIFFESTKGATNAILAKTNIMANVRVFLVIEQSNRIPVNCLKFPLRQMKSVKPKVLLMRGESFD